MKVGRWLGAWLSQPKHLENIPSLKTITKNTTTGARLLSRAEIVAWQQQEQQQEQQQPLQQQQQQ